MEAIRSYLDNIFANLPRTKEVLRAKEEMLANMEEKYLAYKEEGRSENEAIGSVISEFGNIDELLSEFSIEQAVPQKTLRTVSKQEATDWLDLKRRSGLMVAFGVFLIIAGAAAVVFMGSMGHSEFGNYSLPVSTGSAMGVVLMLLMVVLAVALFIYSGMRLERFKFLQEPFILPDAVKKNVEDMKDQYTKTYTLAIIAGVSLCILAPLAIILPVVFLENTPVSQWVILMLLLVGCAVFIFTYFGSIMGSYDQLLKTGDYSEEPENKIIKAVSSAIWPLAVLAFFLMGFLGGLWHIAWIVFPVAALLFPVFITIAKAMKKE
jgi:hypothetical protein